MHRSFPRKETAVKTLTINNSHFSTDLSLTQVFFVLLGFYLLTVALKVVLGFLCLNSFIFKRKILTFFPGEIF